MKGSLCEQTVKKGGTTRYFALVLLLDGGFVFRKFSGMKVIKAQKRERIMQVYEELVAKEG